MTTVSVNSVGVKQTSSSLESLILVFSLVFKFLVFNIRFNNDVKKCRVKNRVQSKLKKEHQEGSESEFLTN